MSRHDIVHCVGRPLITDLNVENLHYLLERTVWREEYAVILAIQTAKTGQGKLVEKLTLILMIVLKHFHLHRVRATARLFFEWQRDKNSNFKSSERYVVP